MLEPVEILNGRILIVDDQEANVLLLEKMLHNAGYTHVESTMQSNAVCDLYRQHRYDLILLDLQMPGMDGFEVMEGLKEIEADYLPVLVITAQPGHKLRALKAGARDFISKPFDLVEVQTRIRNMLEVRLLYRRLGEHNRLLEQAVLERTQELRASEARFKSFTELSSDWYWEQDAHGKFTTISGPVLEILGSEVGPAAGGSPDHNAPARSQLAEKIATRQPFLDLIYRHTSADNTVQVLQVSGEPVFDTASRFAGYRGIGIDITDRARPE